MLQLAVAPLLGVDQPTLHLPEADLTAVDGPAPPSETPFLQISGMKGILDVK
jgi:hypothetical protein